MDYEIASIVPSDPDRPYDVKEIISRVVDTGSFLEVQALWAPNIIIGFGRLQNEITSPAAGHVKSILRN